MLKEQSSASPQTIMSGVITPYLVVAIMIRPVALVMKSKALTDAEPSMRHPGA